MSVHVLDQLKTPSDRESSHRNANEVLRSPSMVPKEKKKAKEKAKEKEKEKEMAKEKGKQSRASLTTGRV